MIVRLRKKQLVVTPEEDDADELAAWLVAHAGQVFQLREIADGGASLHALGPKDEACRLPINITSKSPMPFRRVSNFWHAPFRLDEIEYASIEGFWQGLKFPEEADRRRLADLHGSAAKDAGFYAPKADAFIYLGQTVRTGTWDHWQLMERACAAKFEQNEPARAALLATGTRPLVHQVRPDSKTIPGVIMSEIWTRIRERLSKPRR
jgi:predicted NAD-dependent protein-ADP-ribosyltransferase YbiA (DUF1768 family)